MRVAHVVVQAFRDQYDTNTRDIDALLVTATAWNVDSGDANMPPAGTIVDITACSNIGLFEMSNVKLRSG
ncbi:hypothetical protein ON010_g17147 [Phytophthora cinnamomi]|nr:hypothetical protein ON010_g17147 [Phytophthora cinnamomi]